MPKKSRSSKTGKFVTAAYAKKHKATTEVETIKRKAVAKLEIQRLIAQLSRLVKEL